MINRNNKRLLYMLATGLFISALAGIGAAYMGQLDEQRLLSGEIKAAQSQTNALSTKLLESQQSTLNVTMVKYEADIYSLKKRLTMPLVVSDIFHKVETIASDSNVKIISMRSGSQSAATISDVKYQFISLEFTAVGTEESLYIFVGAITETFTTGILKTAEIKIPQAESPEAAARMNLTIYSYRGE